MTTTIPDERLPGTPGPMTDGQELLLLANRLDGLLDWLKEDHSVHHMIRDMPEKLRTLGTKAVLAEARLSPQAEDGGVTDEMVEAGCEAFGSWRDPMSVKVRRILEAALSAAKKQGEG